MGIETFDPLSLWTLGLEVLAVMAETAPVGLALISPESGAILSINQMAASLLGLAPVDAIGWRVGRLARHDDRRRLALNLKFEGRLDGILVALRGASGRQFLAQVWLRPVLLQGQKLLAACVVNVGEGDRIGCAHSTAGAKRDST